MSSVYGHFATVNRIAFVTTKTALPGLTRAVALECAGTRITCNAICPATVLTPATDVRIHAEMWRLGTSREDAETAYLSARQLPRRFVTDDNVTALVMFVCGPHSANINDAALPIDGGWIAGR